jgi:hypothetical protein
VFRHPSPGRGHAQYAVEDDTLLAFVCSGFAHREKVNCGTIAITCSECISKRLSLFSNSIVCGCKPWIGQAFFRVLSGKQW